MGCRQIMNKTLPASHYVFYLAMLYHMYHAIETVMEEYNANNDPILSYFYFPELRTAPLLLQDLKAFLGPQPKALECWLRFTQTHSVMKYVERLQELKKLNQPHKILAHAYACYMGDLSGGQFMRMNVIRMYQLHDDDEGTRFLKFDGIPNVSFFKDMYRQRLNNIGDDFTLDEKKEIVNEAVHAINLRLAFMQEAEQLIAKQLLPVQEAPVLISLKTKQTEPLLDTPQSTLHKPTTITENKLFISTIWFSTLNSLKSVFAFSLILSIFTWIIFYSISMTSDPGSF